MKAPALVLVLAAAAMALPSGQQPTFRSQAEVVTVDVSVRDRTGRPITGLTAADFSLSDNGVPQAVDEVSYGRVPIDVTVALDVSYSVSGGVLDRLRRGVVDLMRDLRPEDRLKLILFNMRVTRTTDYTTDVKAVERTIRAAAAGGGTALLDAVSVALVDAAPAGRRQLVVFFTDGADSSSTTTPAMLTAVAGRTRATLAIVMPLPIPSMTVTTLSGGATRTTVTPMAGPPRPPLYTYFVSLARDTGGAVIPVNPSGDLSATFRRVLGDFRSAYVLYYTPRGVEPAGYHTLEVGVNRDGAQVQARRGYFGS